MFLEHPLNKISINIGIPLKVLNLFLIRFSFFSSSQGDRVFGNTKSFADKFITVTTKTPSFYSRLNPPSSRDNNNPFLVIL